MSQKYNTEKLKKNGKKIISLCKGDTKSLAVLYFGMYPATCLYIICENINLYRDIEVNIHT